MYTHIYTIYIFYEYFSTHDVFVSAIVNYIRISPQILYCFVSNLISFKICLRSFVYFA